MSFLLPPSRASLRQNLKQLAADWQAGGPLARYFIGSQLLSMVLLGLCSLAALAALLAGLTVAYVGLLVAAMLCLGQTLAAWHFLKTRCGVRYEVW